MAEFKLENKLESEKYHKLLDALELINDKSKSIVQKMRLWRDVSKIPEGDIIQIKNWIRDTKYDEPYKIDRCLMWYIIKKYLQIPAFDDMEIQVKIYSKKSANPFMVINMDEKNE